MPRVRQACFTLMVSLAAACFLSTDIIAQSAPPTHAVPADETRVNLTAKGDSVDGLVRLGIGDLLEINVYNVPELTTKARIGNNGDIYLPLIGYVHVEDLTPEEAQTIIEKRLTDGGFVNHPHVALTIAEYSSQTVSVLGQVARPGSYPVLGERRLYDVISAAGGLSERAGKSVIITHRGAPDKPLQVTLHDVLNLSTEDNVPIRPGDTIIVQKAGVVYVVGDVVRPSGFVMENDRLTVLQALALAGGANKTAKLNSAKILRQSPAGVSETPIALKKILHAKGSDVSLRADDILFIPGSAGKAAVYRAADAVIQAGSLSLVAIRP